MITSFLTNKGLLENAEIMLIYDKKIICNKHELAKVSTKHYLKIAEKSSGQKPTNTAKEYTVDNGKKVAELIFNSYRNLPSILKRKK